ncbi:MAG: PKD domain-containing protein, partial [Bacteroidia bacterium]|nr:PKD domain-containing protein [Bacteroidia bacterium]
MLGVKKIFFLALITVVFQFTNGALLYGQSSLDFSVDVPTGCSPLVVSFLTDSTLYHSHVWNFGDGSSSTLSNPQHIYSNGGSYTVSLIAVHNNGSIDTIVKPNLITINNSPLADYSISTNIACEKDDEVEFTNLSSNFVSSYWDFGDGTGSVLENPVHTFGTHGSYTISLIVYDTNGCFDSKEITNGVQVNPKPSGLISSSTLSTCDKNEIINFSFSNIAVSQYSWSFGDGSVSNLASPFHSYGQEGTFNVELITENSFGCTDTNQLAAGISILFNPVPEMNLSDSIFCLPASIGLSTNASNVANHTWSASNGFTSQAFSTTLSTSLVDTIGINLNVEYSNGCINSNNKTVVTLPTPAPSYGMLNSSGCAPLDVQLVNNTVGNYTWLWDFKDSTYSSLNNPIHTYNEAGTYIPILTATNSYGCSASWATPSFIRVNKPSANFISSVIGGCKPLEVEFICMSTGITQCQWNFGDGNTSLDINPVHVYSQIGSYNVMLIVTDIYGCTDTLTKPDYISVGIKDVQI